MKKVLLSIGLMFTASISFAQNFDWAKSIGGSGDDRANVIKLDASGNIYVGGAFSGTVDFDPGAGSSPLTSAGGFDVFVAKYDPSGNFLWANKGGTAFNESLAAMAIDNNGNVIITGIGMLNSDGTSRAMFAIKASASGVEQWNHTFNSDASNMGGYALTTDDNNNIYIAGNFKGTADFNPDPGAVTNSSSQGSGSDAYVLILNALGEFVNVKTFRTNNANANIFGITVDGSGNIYSTGQYWNSLDCDPGPETAYLGHSGNGDAFISKLDSNGDYVWAKKIGGGGSDFASSITLDASGNVITTGYFDGTVDFDPGSGTSNLTSAGGRDIYVSKLDSNGDYVWAKKMGSGNYDRGNSVTTDVAGNVYTTGFYEGTVDFDPGAGTSEFTSNTNSIDIFVQKLNPNGDFVWAHSIGSENSDSGTSILIDGSNNIYFTGNFSGTVDVDPSSSESNYTTEGGDDFFFVKWSQPIVGIGENVLLNSMSLYPNPTTGVLNIKNGLGSARIMDLTGKVVLETAVTDDQIDVSNLLNGVYLLELTTEKGIATQRFIKE